LPEALQITGSFLFKLMVHFYPKTENEEKKSGEDLPN